MRVLPFCNKMSIRTNLKPYYKTRKIPSLVDFRSLYQLYTCKYIVIVPNYKLVLIFVLINEGQSNRKFSKIFAGKNLCGWLTQNHLIMT